MAENLARSSVAESDVVPIGGDDPDRTRAIVAAMYAFLVNKPKNTRRTYRHGVRQFLDLVQWKDLCSVSAEDAEEYKRYLVNYGYSKSTICTRLAAVDAFFTFLAHKKTISRNPFDLLGRKDVLPDDETTTATGVEWADFQKMVDALPTDPIGMRDRAVLIFLAYTGRRRSEVADLRIRDLSLSTSPRTYRVTGKRGPKNFKLPDEAYTAIQAHWLSAGRLKRLGPDSGVFGEAKACPIAPGLDPERPLHNDVIWTIVKRAAVRAGLDPAKVKVLRGLRRLADRDGDERDDVRLHDAQRLLDLAWPNATRLYLGQLRAPPPSLVNSLRRVREAAVTMAGPIIG